MTCAPATQLDCPLFEEPATIGLRAWRPVYGAVEGLSFHQVGFGVVFYLGILWYRIMENHMEKKMRNEMETGVI